MIDGFGQLNYDKFRASAFFRDKQALAGISGETGQAKPGSPHVRHQP
jgi:hypothetical protein